MEAQIGALGLVLNALVLFNTRSVDAAVARLCADGLDVRDRDVAPSPLRAAPHQHAPPVLLPTIGTARWPAAPERSERRRRGVIESE
ncbi:Tn3 family transposase [Streptomyces virginiae]|nr:Tn3 family transposase [Streptomyces virginiae]